MCLTVYHSYQNAVCFPQMPSTNRARASFVYAEFSSMFHEHTSAIFHKALEQNTEHMNYKSCLVPLEHSCPYPLPSVRFKGVPSLIATSTR